MKGRALTRGGLTGTPKRRDYCEATRAVMYG